MSLPAPAKRLGRPEVVVPAGFSMMTSVRERPEAESGLEDAAPPRVRESRQEAAATAGHPANLSVQWSVRDGGASEHQFEEKEEAGKEPEEVSEDDSEEENSEEELEEESGEEPVPERLLRPKEEGPKRVIMRLGGFGRQVTCAAPASACAPFFPTLIGMKASQSSRGLGPSRWQRSDGGMTVRH